MPNTAGKSHGNTIAIGELPNCGRSAGEVEIDWQILSMYAPLMPNILQVMVSYLVLAGGRARSSILSFSLGILDGSAAGQLTNYDLTSTVGVDESSSMVFSQFLSTIIDSARRSG